MRVCVEIVMGPYSLVLLKSIWIQSTAAHQLSFCCVGAGNKLLESAGEAPVTRCQHGVPSGRHILMLVRHSEP